MMIELIYFFSKMGDAFLQKWSWWWCWREHPKIFQKKARATASRGAGATASRTTSKRHHEMQRKLKIKMQCFLSHNKRSYVLSGQHLLPFNTCSRSTLAQPTYHRLTGKPLNFSRIFFSKKFREKFTHDAILIIRPLCPFWGNLECRTSFGKI